MIRTNIYVNVGFKMKNVVVVGLLLLVMMRCYENRVLSQNLVDMLELEHNSNTKLENEDVGEQGSWLRLKRDPRPPTDLDTKGASNSQEDPGQNRASHSHHLMDHIMHDVHAGHVTQDKIDHWFKEIQAALDHGSLGMDEVNQFINALKESHTYNMDNCCLFGK